jgi:hypothetical protein
MDTMKATVSNTTFFNSLLGDDMQTLYSLKNPYTGDELVRCDASELTSFLSYFRGLIGVWDIPYEVVA